MESRNDDPTLPASAPSRPSSLHDVSLDLEAGDRYQLGAVLGRGGMGEVRIARDERVEREVAIKLMRGADRDEAAIARFFREARVQGGLEHPAIVPVHDLGIDRNGNPYFVMKRLAGTTLGEVLARPSETWPRRQLLARLVDVCLALELAHSRGVIHRDLKPANIMLGDFGEVYVLDWGVARIVGDSDTFRSVAPITGEETAAGSILGTPGYMSPEQARGDASERSDVFALGCILYEILAGRPALPRGLAALSEGPETTARRPSTEAPDVPPELDDLCARATAARPADRPTARELATAIQAYLDGDRDLARRRELAAEHAARAAHELERSGDDARAAAMVEAGRAFTLDPTNRSAHDLLTRLMITAPTAIPAGALAAADAERGRTRQSVLRFASRAFVFFTLMPLGLLAMRVHHAWPIISMSIVSAALTAACALAGRRVLPMRTPWFYVLLTLDVMLLATTGLIFGPLLVLPIFVIGSLAVWLAQPARYSVAIVVIAHLLAIVPLLVLELARITPSTFEIHRGGLLLTPWAIELTPWSALAIMATAFAAQLVNTTLIAFYGKISQETAQNRVHAQSWHLRQLLPGGGQSPSGE